MRQERVVGRAAYHEVTGLDKVDRVLGPLRGDLSLAPHEELDEREEECQVLGVQGELEPGVREHVPPARAVEVTHDHSKHVAITDLRPVDDVFLDVF